ncbi:MAG TPA: hypothetical protein VF376_04525, partial [Thermoanaerobaculia bacterium]
MPLVAAILLATTSNGVSLTAHLDGSGLPRIVTAVARGTKIRIEVDDAFGKRMARIDAPSPASNARVTLETGSLGSAGALIEVAGTSGGRECRTLWRLRDKTISRVDIIGPGGPLPDCAATGEWTYRWEQSRPDAPADYRRERTRSTPDGPHHESQVYRYVGFRVELDRALSTATIGDVSIPSWPKNVLYPRPALENLLQRFDLSPLRKAPTLRFETDQENGIFAAVLQRSGVTERFRVTGTAPGQEKNELDLTLADGLKSGHALVRLGSDRSTALDVLVRGLGDDLESAFAPVTQFNGASLEVYETAEQELATAVLPGSWDSSSGEHVQIALVSSSPAVVRLGASEFKLSITAAPSGTDVLLIPEKASPSLALTLRGPDAISRVNVSCDPPSSGGEPLCRADGGGLLFHRLGSSIA